MRVKLSAFLGFCIVMFYGSSGGLYGLSYVRGNLFPDGYSFFKNIGFVLTLWVVGSIISYIFLGTLSTGRAIAAFVLMLGALFIGYLATSDSEAGLLQRITGMGFFSTIFVFIPSMIAFWCLLSLLVSIILAITGFGFFASSAAFRSVDRTANSFGNAVYKTITSPTRDDYAARRKARRAADERANARWHALDNAKKAEYDAQDAAKRGKDIAAGQYQNQADYYYNESRK